MLAGVLDQVRRASTHSRLSGSRAPVSVPREGTRSMPSLTPNRAAPTGNRLLDALPNGEREQLLQAMKRLPIRPREMLQEPGRAMRQVYFPLSGVVSLMIPLVEGAAIETAPMGSGGMVGVHACRGGGPLGNGQAMSQVPGEMLAINVDTFRAEANGDGKL